MEYKRGDLVLYNGRVHKVVSPGKGVLAIESTKIPSTVRAVYTSFVSPVEDNESLLSLLRRGYCEEADLR